MVFSSREEDTDSIVVRGDDVDIKCNLGVDGGGTEEVLREE